MTQLLTLLFLLISFNLFSQKENPRTFSNLAIQAYKLHDYSNFLLNMKKAFELSNTHETYIYNLAIAYAYNNKKNEAIDMLKRGLSFGFIYPLEHDEDLKSLRDEKEFKELLVLNQENKKIKATSKSVAKLPAKMIIAEGLQYNPNKSSYFISDIYHGLIYEINKEGKILWQSGDYGFGSVAGLKNDSQKKLLYGTFVHQPISKNLTGSLNGESGIFCIDLNTNKLLFQKTIKPDTYVKHWLGDLIIDSHQTIYASDSYAGNIYKFSPPGYNPEIILALSGMHSLQGITLTPDNKYMIFSDYPNGLFALSLESSDLKKIGNLTNNTLLGIDGIYYYEGNVIAVQNGINPPRIIEIILNENYHTAISLKVLEVNNPDCNDMTLGTINNDSFYFIANGQWNKFDNNGNLADSTFTDIKVKRIKLK